MSATLSLKFKDNKAFAAYDLTDAGTLTETWKVCAKVARCLEQGRRLENLSWRLWHLQNLTVTSDNALRKWKFKKLFKLPGGKLSKEQGGSAIGLKASTAAAVANDVINYNNEEPSSLTSNAAKPPIPQNDQSLAPYYPTPFHPSPASYGEGSTSNNDNYLDHFDFIRRMIGPTFEPLHPWFPTTSIYQDLLSKNGPFWVAAGGHFPPHPTTRYSIDDNEMTLYTTNGNKLTRPPIDDNKTPRASPADSGQPSNPQNPVSNAGTHRYFIRDTRTPRNPIDDNKTPRASPGDAGPPPNPQNPVKNAKTSRYLIRDTTTPRNPINPRLPQNSFTNARTLQYPIDDAKTPQNPIDNATFRTGPFTNTLQYLIDNAKTPTNPVDNAETPANPTNSTKTPQNPIRPSVPASRRERYKSRFTDKTPESPRSPRRPRAHSPDLRGRHSPGPSDRSSESPREQRQTRTRSRDRGSRSGSVSEGHQSPEDDGESKKKVDWLT